jgi:hypothetical protein
MTYGEKRADPAWQLAELYAERRVWGETETEAQDYIVKFIERRSGRPANRDKLAAVFRDGEKRFLAAPTFPRIQTIYAPAQNDPNCDQTIKVIDGLSPINKDAVQRAATAAIRNRKAEATKKRQDALDRAILQCEPDPSRMSSYINGKTAKSKQMHPSKDAVHQALRDVLPGYKPAQKTIRDRILALKRESAGKNS